MSLSSISRRHPSTLWPRSFAVSPADRCGGVTYAAVTEGSQAPSIRSPSLKRTSHRLFTSLPDLADPSTLADLGIRPDRLASEDRRVTQAISRGIHERDYPGFRWWSALKGDWHATILFLDRVPLDTIEYGQPDPLHLEHSVVERVRHELRMLHMAML